MNEFILKYIKISVIIYIFSVISIANSQNEQVITNASTLGWMAVNVRADSTVAVTTTQSRVGLVSSQGDSSIEFKTVYATAGQDKADYQLVWQNSVISIDFPNRILSNLTHLSYEYYRDSTSAVTNHLHPSFRLMWAHDSNTPLNLSDDTIGFLIYEETYQPGFVAPIATDSWLNRDIKDSEFWMYCIDCDSSAIIASGVVQNFNLTLSDWLNGPQTGVGGDPTPPDFSSGSTYIIGVNTGIGSGWGADVLMFVDNIRIAFGVGDDLLFNFEDDISAFASPKEIPSLRTWSLVFLMLMITILLLFRVKKPIYK